MSYQPIESYGVIGDLLIAGLISSAYDLDRRLTCQALLEVPGTFDFRDFTA